MKTNLSKVLANHIKYKALIEAAENLRLAVEVPLGDFYYVVTHLHYDKVQYSVWVRGELTVSYAMFAISQENSIELLTPGKYDKETIKQMRSTLCNYLNKCEE